MDGRQPGQEVCLEVMKRCPRVQQWHDVKNKVGNI